MPNCWILRNLGQMVRSAPSPERRHRRPGRHRRPATGPATGPAAGGNCSCGLPGAALSLALVAQSDPMAFSSVRPEASSRTCGPLELAELVMLAAETPEEFAQAQAMDFATLAEELVAFEHRQPLAATGAPATGGPATGAPASLAATGAPATGGPAVPPTPQPAIPPTPQEFEVLFPVSQNGFTYPSYDEVEGMWIPPPPW